MFKMDSLADNGLKADESTSQREVYFEQKHHTQRHNLKFKNLLSPIKIIILASPYIIILLNNKKKKQTQNRILRRRNKDDYVTHVDKLENKQMVNW
jgi:glycyl-tRNA synthetase (class II)